MGLNWINYIYQVSVVILILSLAMIFFIFLRRLYKMSLKSKYALSTSGVEFNLLEGVVGNKKSVTPQVTSLELKNAFKFYKDGQENTSNQISKNLSEFSNIFLNQKNKKRFKRFILFSLDQKNLNLTVEGYENYSIENLLYIENYFSTERNLNIKILFKKFAKKDKSIHITGNLSKTIFFPFVDKENLFDKLFLFSFLLNEKIPIILLFIGNKKLRSEDIEHIFKIIKEFQEDTKQYSI